MAVTPDDDVPDGDTTAAGVAPAAASAGESDEEDRTVQQLPDPRVNNAIRNAMTEARARPPPRAPVAPVAVPSAAKPGVKPAMNVTSKKMTVVGLAPPGSTPQTPTSPLVANGPGLRPGQGSSAAFTTAAFAKATPAPPQIGAPLGPRPAAPPSSEAEEDDASITATAPAPRVPGNASPGQSIIPQLMVPGVVQIREMPPAVEDEPLDETEVRTVVSAPLDNPAPVASAAAAKLTAAKVAAASVAKLAPKPVATSASAARPAPTPAKPVPVAQRPPKDAQPTIITDELIEEDDELEDSVTTQAPAQVIGTLPEEDEPKTSPPVRLPPPIPAAGRSPFDEPPIRSPATPAEDDDAYNAEESVTTRGPAVPDFRLDDSSVMPAPPVSEGPDSSGRWPAPVKLPSGQIGQRPATMSQALGLPPAGMGVPPPIEDHTEGTTNRFAGVGAGPRRGPPRPTATTQSAAETEQGSVTAQAPSLRVINQAQPAALNVLPTLSDPDGDDEDDGNNHTAVMINAPTSPQYPSGSSRAARSALVSGMGGGGQSGGVHARAPDHRSDPSSDSGLRVSHEKQQPYYATPQPQPQGDQASLGAMMAGALAHHGAASDRGSGIASREYPSQPMMPVGPPMHFPQSEPSMALGATIPANSPHMRALQGNAMNNQMMAQMGQMQQYDFASTIKKPRYGLLVGLVALLSFAIPLVLFLWLHQSVQEPSQRSPNEPGADHVGLAAPSATAKLAPSASASGSAKPGVRPPPPGPRHR